MIYFYRVVDLTTGKVYNAQTDLDEFLSYRDFISYLEGNNSLWAGTLKFEESRKEVLTSEFDLV
jgi:hypothetical protein